MSPPSLSSPTLKQLARANLRLVPVMATALVDNAASWRAARRAALVTLADFGIDARVDDRSGITRETLGRGGHLFVHLDQQTLLSTVLYPLVIAGPCSLVVNVEFAALPAFGWLSMMQGAVPIVRQWPNQAKRALATVVKRLRTGDNFAMSIEGRRTPDGRLSPYKKGPAVLAIEASATIVPFMTHGEYRLWPRGSRFPRPGRVDIVVYPAMSTRELTYADRDEVVHALRELAERERSARGIEC